MKLKFKIAIFLSLTTIALLSLGSCKDKSAPSNLISENDQEAIDKFDENYFAKYNDTFIPNIDDENFKPSDLAFHTWAWQKYLHLTQSIKNNSGDRTKDNLPLFLDEESIYQITPNGERFYAIEGKDTLKYKKSELVLSAFHQAGSDHPILTSNKNFGDRQNDYTVFYSIHMNKIMYDQMVDSTNSVIQKIGDKIPEVDVDFILKKSEYKNGALELKAAWINVKAISKNIENYIVVNKVPMLKETVVKRIDKELRDKEQKIKVLKTEIAKAKGEDKNTKVKELNDLIDNPIYSPIESDYETVDVALIGLHVVGKVNGFPELLWATFEGQDLAPDNLHNLTDYNSSKRYKAKTPENLYGSKVVTSKQDFLFYKKDDLAMSGADSVIVFNPKNSKGKVEDKVFRKYPLGVSIDKLLDNHFYTHALLENALNSKASANKQIKHYYNGNIWLGEINKSISRIEDVYNQLTTSDKKLAGSPNATNVTMESFKQSTNCFSCHTGKNSFKGKYILNEKGELQNEYTKEYNSTLNVSHIYTSYFNNKLGKKLYPNTKQEEVNAVNEYIKTLNEQKLEATFK